MYTNPNYTQLVNTPASCNFDALRLMRVREVTEALLSSLEAEPETIEVHATIFMDGQAGFVIDFASEDDVEDLREDIAGQLEQAAGDMLYGENVTALVVGPVIVAPWAVSRVEGVSVRETEDALERDLYRPGRL